MRGCRAAGEKKKRDNANRLTDIIDAGLVRHVLSNAIPDLNLDRIPPDTCATIFLVTQRFTEQSGP